MAPPIRLKRRSDAISRDPSDTESDADTGPPAQRRRRQSSTPASTSSRASSSPASPGESRSLTQDQILVKKLVRLALATEYARTPLRRTDISTKVFKESNARGRGFKAVFERAQQTLQDTFGMQLVELPFKEKTSLKDRRAQATQTKAASHASTRSWILVSVLPDELKANPRIVQPARAPTVDTEAAYTALYTFILSLIYLNNNALTDGKLERYLSRVNADTFTPFGSLDKLLQRMMREGYIDRRRDTTTGEEIVEWFPGPRGKVEVGVRGVAGLVRSVYGHGAAALGPAPERPSHADPGDGDGDGGGEENGRDPLIKMEEDELNARLTRSLGVKFTRGGIEPRSGGDRADPDPDRADESRDASPEPVSEAPRRRHSTSGQAGRRAHDD